MAEGNSTRGAPRRLLIFSALAGLIAAAGGMPPINGFPVPVRSGGQRRSRPIERRDRSLPKRAGQYERRYRNVGSQRTGPKSNSPRGKSW